MFVNIKEEKNPETENTLEMRDSQVRMSIKNQERGIKIFINPYYLHQGSGNVAEKEAERMQELEDGGRETVKCNVPNSTWLLCELSQSSSSSLHKIYTRSCQ